MKGQQKNISDIDFGRDKVTVYLTDAEYERIESVGRDGFNDGRAVRAGDGDDRLSPDTR